MQPLPRIPLVDLRGYTPLELLFLYRRQARQLAEAATDTLGGVSGKVSRALLPGIDRMSRRWLEKAHNPYLGEIEMIAEAVGVPGAYTLNICLEWGCTTGVWSGETGPLMRRVLDWPFPSLGENIVVVHQNGRVGDFYNVTWPGFCGVLHAMAPGRFAAAVSQAPLRRHHAGIVGDWFYGRLAVGKSLALPPAHLLRQVFETARDYGAAKSMLCSTPVALPAIFTLSGTRPGEGCVIERIEDDYAVRDIEGGRVCAANHFESTLNDKGAGWRARPIDSPGRLEQALAIRGTLAGFAWFTPPIANVNSRLAMTANAARGTLAVMGTAGERPVTEVFQLQP